MKYLATFVKSGCCIIEANSIDEASDIADNKKEDNIVWSRDWDLFDIVEKPQVQEFNIGDRVRFTDELLQYAINAEWRDQCGTIIDHVCIGYDLIQWDHMDYPIKQPTDYIELVDEGGKRNEF